MSAEGGTKAVVAALFANCFIAVTKLGAWVLTGASSILAEAIHSIADAGNQVLLLVGGRRSKKEATEQHPFGYGRERYIFGFIVSVVLFSVGGFSRSTRRTTNGMRSKKATRTSCWRVGGGGFRSSSCSLRSWPKVSHSGLPSGNPTRYAASKPGANTSAQPRHRSCR